MKKNIFIIAILSLLMLATACSNDSTQEKKTLKQGKAEKFDINEKNDLSDLKLCGKVKSSKSISYEAVVKSGNVSKGKIIEDTYSYMVFNEQGNILEENNYKRDSILTSKKLYKYNEFGNLIEGKIYKPASILTEQQVFVYNSDRKLISKTVTTYDEKGKLKGTSIDFFNDQGNRIASSDYNADSILTRKFSAEYDHRGNLIHRSSQNKEGKVVFENSFVYDNNGKVAKEIISWEDQVSTKYTYEYNEQGYLARKSTFSGHGFNMVSSYSYDEDGNLIERYITGGSNPQRWTYNYDDQGQAIEEIEYKCGIISLFDETVAKSSSLFEYDSKGNWIKKILYDNEIPKSIIERKFEYFN